MMTNPLESSSKHFQKVCLPLHLVHEPEFPRKCHFWVFFLFFSSTQIPVTLLSLYCFGVEAFAPPEDLPVGEGDSWTFTTSGPGELFLTSVRNGRRCRKRVLTHHCQCPLQTKGPSTPGKTGGHFIVTLLLWSRGLRTTRGFTGGVKLVPDNYKPCKTCSNPGYTGPIIKTLGYLCLQRTVVETRRKWTRPMFN
jgi:hypothetical protein